MPSLGKIAIKCQSVDNLPLDEIKDFQGNLKKRTPDDIQNIKNKILEVGFSFPFFIWKSNGNYCLDGHGRIQALKELAEDGYELPLAFPVVYIDAKSKKEAKEKLLQVISSYGRITPDGLAEFSDGLSLDLSNLSFADSYIDFSGNVFKEEGDLSPRQNAMKIAVFRNYHIPVSNDDIAGFSERLATYEAETGSRKGFFMQYLGPFVSEKQQEIS